MELSTSLVERWNCFYSSATVYCLCDGGIMSLLLISSTHCPHHWFSSPNTYKRVTRSMGAGWFELFHDCVRHSVSIHFHFFDSMDDCITSICFDLGVLSSAYCRWNTSNAFVTLETEHIYPKERRRPPKTTPAYAPRPLGNSSNIIKISDLSTPRAEKAEPS